ncbi:hypothetical protein [Hydrogenimonas sp. SS33]|uniref:hypothetical protein n=1 Tax=Hydrogenimonas leucolamina TaxID=2954236 RepID=UPI00336BF0AC
MRRPAALTLATFVLLGLAGCQQNNRKVDEQRPILLGEKKSPVNSYAQTILENSTQPKTVDLKAKKMELKAQQEIERIKAEKELQIARLKAESEKAKVQGELTMTMKKLQARLEEVVGKRKIAGWVIFLSALFLFLLLWVVVKLFRDYHKHKLRLEEERMRHEKELQEKEVQTRLAEKMFDALASGNLTEAQQERLIETVAGSKPLLTMKKDSGDDAT